MMDLKTCPFSLSGISGSQMAPATSHRSVQAAEIWPLIGRDHLGDEEECGHLSAIYDYFNHVSAPSQSLYVQALLYAACSALAAFAVLFMPETRRARLPLDAGDAECVAPPSGTVAPEPPPVVTTVVHSADT